MHYLDVEGLEAGAVQQAHFQDSSEDEVVEREGPVPLDFTFDSGALECLYIECTSMHLSSELGFGCLLSCHVHTLPLWGHQGLALTHRLG